LLVGRISLVASREVGVEVDAGETKYWFTLLYQNVGQNHYSRDC